MIPKWIILILIWLLRLFLSLFPLHLDCFSFFFRDVEAAPLYEDAFSEEEECTEQYSLLNEDEQVLYFSFPSLSPLSHLPIASKRGAAKLLGWMLQSLWWVFAHVKLIFVLVLSL